MLMCILYRVPHTNLKRWGKNGFIIPARSWKASCCCKVKGTTEFVPVSRDPAPDSGRRECWVGCPVFSRLPPASASRGGPLRVRFSVVFSSASTLSRTVRVKA